MAIPQTINSAGVPHFSPSILTHPDPPLVRGEQEETNLSSPLSKGGQRGVPPTLTDAEYEAKFMELLEGVNEGWGRGDVADSYSQNALKMVIWRLGCGGLAIDCWRAGTGTRPYGCGGIASGIGAQVGVVE